MRSFLASRFELPNYTGRIVPFEGLRGFAALIVFFVHFKALFGDYLPSGSFLHRVTSVTGAFGHTGVDIFFVLSGYLIYGIVMRDRFRYGPYLRRRFRRLYPTFLGVFVLYLVLSVLFPEHSKLPGPPVAKLIYILANLAMLPGVLNIVPVIAPAWSLSYELVYYVSLPLIVAALAIRRWRWWSRIAFFLFLALLHVILCAVGIDGHVRFVMFAAGIVIWELGQNLALAGRLNAWGELAAILAFCAALAILGILYSNDGMTTVVMTKAPRVYGLLMFVTAFFLVLHAAFFDGILKKIFSWDYLRWVGNMSYSYYLIHGLTLHGVLLVLNSQFGWLPHSDFNFVLLFGICVVASLTCAGVLYLYLEKPFLLETRAIRRATEREPVAQAKEG
jgi:exopolysaccharide production protein ExoZ